MTTSLSIPLLVSRTAGSQGALPRQPLTGGIPLPRGVATDLNGWLLHDPESRSLPFQLAATERWPDGSLRWVLLDTQVNLPAGQAPLSLTLTRHGQRTVGGNNALRVDRDGVTLTVDTGSARFLLSPDAQCLVDQCSNSSGLVVERSALTVRGESGEPWAIRWQAPTVEVENGLRAVVSAQGTALDAAGRAAHLVIRLEFYAGHGAVRGRLTVRNPKKAEHPGGIWELGDSGSLLLRELSVSFGRTPADESGIHWRADAERSGSASRAFHLHQESSGGDNWASTNHVNRRGTVPLRYRGYKLTADDASQTGLRAEPSAVLGSGARQLGLAIPRFWQNFPQALSASTSELTASFFSPMSADLHELQGGEQKTFEWYLLAGEDTAPDEPLGWCHARPLMHAEPRWYAESEALKYFVTGADDDPTYRSLVDAAITGPDTFFGKREVADEYGWRHFGDIYGDHEAVFHKGPTPLMSHYNNQYDPVGGFLYQFMRTGDVRWWTQCLELAAHVVDIDIYHTNQDKSAYNNGLFWHTYHYVDAAKAMHRSYPTGTVGGGPSSEQNYTTGLMLHYLMTGDVASRGASLGLSQFVVDIDDGTKTIFKWLAKGFTGIASASRSFDYHGPGRGSGNSLNALVDGHRLSGDRAYLDKAEQIIRRCTHPRQDIQTLQLLDPENRWFYTMYLQALAKYLDRKLELGELDAMYAYGRDVLLHFARWMAPSERPYLDRPDLLEYPTETWPAQDIRKSEIFDATARHTDGDERDRFLERAEFFFTYCTSTLASLPTRTLARPVVLLLSHGYRRAHVRLHGVDSAPSPSEGWEARWPTPEVFVPQKVRAMRRAKMIVAAFGILGIAALATLVRWLL